MITRKECNNLVAVVPVRAGSKGLPGKNTLPLAGLPLYQHAVRQGVRTVGRVLLSTDIDEISDSNTMEGCRLIRRPAALGTDDTPMEEVIRHLIESESLWGCTLVLLQATTPLRSDDDITAALALYWTGEYDLVMSVVECEREVLKYGTIEGNHFTAMRDSSFCFQNRQQLPPVFGPNGAVYVFSADKFMASGGFPTRRIGAVKMPPERSMDIDTAEDVESIERSGFL